MRRGWTLAAASMAGLALLAAACGTDGGEAATTSTTRVTTAPPPTASPPAPFDSTTTTAPAPDARTTALPTTGQTTCFDDEATIDCPEEGGAFFGQDGQVQAGGPLSYTDGGDGTVTDDVTGLMWQQVPTTSTWADAAADAAAADTGGHADWRVPTVTELWSLLDLADGDGPGDEAAPQLDADAFGTGDTGGPGDRYLTSTDSPSPTAAGTPAFFVVDVGAGRTRTVPETAAGTTRPLALRLVRGGEGYGEQDLTGNGDGTITDEATGLTWLQADSGDDAFTDAVAGTAAGDGTLDWEEALAFCADLDVAGIDGWRLPNAKELQSLVDLGRVTTGGAPAIDPLFATTPPPDGSSGRPTTEASAYWTSTTARPAAADVVHFGRVLGPDDAPPTGGRVPGSVRAVPKAGDARLLARCVSGGAVSGGAGVSPL